MSTRLPPIVLASSLSLGLAIGAGCGDDDTETVPADVPRVAATPTCVPRAAGSRVVGVSSEGELWLVDDAGKTVVIDAGGTVHDGVARAAD